MAAASTATVPRLLSIEKYLNTTYRPDVDFVDDSPRDSLQAMRRRAQDYVDMGVPQVWIFDPQKRTAYACSGDSMTEHNEGILKLEGSNIAISLEEAFRPLKHK